MLQNGEALKLSPLSPRPISKNEYKIMDFILNHFSVFFAALFFKSLPNKGPYPEKP